jgi:hypothetical protein
MLPTFIYVYLLPASFVVWQCPSKFI